MMKNSIKRGQSQAGLSFAERKNFRPQVKNKLLLLLALLLTAATGAWADGVSIKFEANGHEKVVENVTLPYTFRCNYDSEDGELDRIIKEFYGLSMGCCYQNSPTSDNSNVTAFLDGDNQCITIKSAFEGTAKVTGVYYDYDSNIYYELTISVRGSGEEAQEETLLTTVTATGMSTYSQSPDGVVTVVVSGNDTYDADWGWYRLDEGTATITVTAAEGYTITRCVFKQYPSDYPNRVLEDDKTPFVMTINGAGIGFGSCFVEASNGQRNGPNSMDGASVIEVYGAAPAGPTTYKVTMKDGVKDADKWTIEPTEAKPGTEIKATYSGNRRVKSVKAVKKAAEKPVATLTEAPKPWDEYYVGDELLETLGTAEGGTLMYKLTTTNVKPTSTEGFSTENPKGVENAPSYKNYIWYYIKGDDTHSDSEIFGPIELDVWDS
jgi:hypothetical protein